MKKTMVKYQYKGEKITEDEAVTLWLKYNAIHTMYKLLCEAV